MIKKLEDVGYTVEHLWSSPAPGPEEGADPVEPTETIVHVTGHGVDTTIYTHDEESIADLLSHVDEPHPRFTPYVPGSATAGD